MKALRIIITSILLLYLLLLGGASYLFQATEQHRQTIQGYLSYLMGREVQVQSVTTGWNKLNPEMLISGVYIQGDTSQQPALTIKNMAVEINWWSVMKLWPQFEELSIAEPRLEIVSLEDGGLQVAGLKLKHGERKGKMSHRAINWFLHHHNIDLYAGEIIWRKQSDKIQRYQDIAFVFRREGQKRNIKASALGDKGQLAFVTDLNGDILASKEWDASFQVFDGDGEQMLTSEDLEISVEKGRGIFQLTQLDPERVTDIFRIAGVGSNFEKWLFDAQLQGALNDVTFNFSGPLLNPDNWGLTARISGMQLSQTDHSPSFQNLSGQLDMSDAGGRFDFLLEDSLIKWSKYIDHEHTIDKAQGQFRWDFSNKDEARIQLKNAVLDNITVSAKEIDLTVLKYPRKPLYLDAKMQIDIPAMQKLADFFPNMGTGKFKKWWYQAFISGGVQNANLHYQGWLSRSAMEKQRMQLEGDGYYDNLNFDYGPKHGWPIVRNSDGRFSFDGQNMHFYPQHAWIEDAEIIKPEINIKNMFSHKRELFLKANTTAKFKDVLAFIFQGPMIKSEESKKNPPMVGLDGEVDAQMEITIPLSDRDNATLNGIANVRNGVAELDGGVQITDISGEVTFTESSSHSEHVTGKFLGGKMQGKLTTVKPGKPPELELTASGEFDPQYLEPWLGKPMLSIMKGSSQWQGKINITKHVIYIDVNTDLVGIEVDLPEPEFKAAGTAKSFNLQMALSNKQAKELTYSYGDYFKAKFKGDVQRKNHFFDFAELAYGKYEKAVADKRGININIDTDEFNADEWIEKIVEICEVGDSGNTDFADALRTIHVNSKATELLGRDFGELDVKAFSDDGKQWRGDVQGKNAIGKLHFMPRANPASYNFDLVYLNYPETEEETSDELSQQMPTDFPAVNVQAEKFVFLGKPMGQMSFDAMPDGDEWRVTSLKLEKPGINADISGVWKPHQTLGSQSLFEIEVNYGQAGEALEDFGFSDFMANGGGSFTSRLNWQGGVGDFAMKRLNGSYELKVKNGRLLQIEPKSGKLLGLLNLNAVSRRLRLDFSDIFAQGLEFDRMESVGKLENGDMILEGTYIISPSVYIQSEGRIGLAKEDYDMQVKVSPEFGGNIALFTALANPAAGALVFLTQKLFRKELSSVNYFTYEVRGPWKSPEITKIDNNTKSKQSKNETKVAENEGIEEK